MDECEGGYKFRVTAWYSITNDERIRSSSFVRESCKKGRHLSTIRFATGLLTARGRHRSNQGRFQAQIFKRAPGPWDSNDAGMTDDSKTYDLVVIGGGPAGVTAATTALGFGKSVALVDSQPEIGGAGINTGTVPSKTLRETALALSGFQSRNLYGVDLSLRREVTVSDFLKHEIQVKDAFHTMITRRLHLLNATIYCGMCDFVDAHTVRVSLCADKLKDSAGRGDAPARREDDGRLALVRETDAQSLEGAPTSMRIVAGEIARGELAYQPALLPQELAAEVAANRESSARMDNALGTVMERSRELSAQALELQAESRKLAEMLARAQARIAELEAASRPAAVAKPAGGRAEAGEPRD